ncbi:bifunctional alpha/beta hydrolase/OsmC family protein [Aurantiacibacter poecillastricola]|uniref:bifunctional alpha/beta hydrolase/OsmC family protein n=1 Tax=Aurantiacibacter poecillastricola TaxID=3064385 RepID=UPI00273D685A|nr:alpha/beta fold hydrolase [Aurantiacibacter sp. 219JJ12-13]MDP5262486.1 alpha/beta fold hydrolase [Aurantiacibacter sp. 219JJ12-13]
MIATEKFTFTGKDGQTLDGRLEMPLYSKPRAAALFAHCFTCTKNSHAATRVASALAAKGLAVLRFDFTGLGGSDGDFANAGFATNVEDLIAAAKALEERGLPPVLLVGHSLGGAAVLAAAEQVPQVRAVATLNAPYDAAHVFEHFGDAVDDIEEDGEGEVTLAGRKFRIARSFLEQGRDQPQGERIANLGLPLMVMHTPQDEVVGIENARLIFEKAVHPKSFVALDGADHLLTKPGCAEYAANMIAAWATPFLSDLTKERREDFAGTVEVSTAGGKFAQWVRTANHEFIADEPTDIGGSDHGPTPYDLLMAALGTCTSMTIKMYADRKGIALDNVRIELEHSRDHHTDCIDCEKSGAPIQVIDRAIELSGDFTEEQRQRMMEIADMCPVHKTLEGDLHIHSTAILD